MATFNARSTAEQVSAGIDLNGRVFIVTGASAGIGVETVRVLALRGATVIGAARDLEKGQKAWSNFINDDNKDRLHLLPLDLADLASVREFVEKFKDMNLPLHVSH